MGELDAAEEAYKETLIHFRKMGHRPAIAHELECLAFIAQARQMPERTACLFGAAEALRGTANAPMLPHEQEEYDLALAALKQELNDSALQQAWMAGSVMDIDQAVDYALASPKLKGD